MRVTVEGGTGEDDFVAERIGFVVSVSDAESSPARAKSSASSSLSDILGKRLGNQGFALGCLCWK